MANLYNTTLITNSEEATGRFMDVGIHENVELTKVEYNVSKNGNKFIAFYFENADKQTLSHTEWEVATEITDKAIRSLVDTSAKNKQEISYEQARQLLEKWREVKVINQMARIEQIATKFVPKEKLLINATDFESYAKNIVRILTGTFTGVQLRIKAVYNKDYVGLPGNYGIMKKDGSARQMIQFIERIDQVPTEKSKLKIISSFDSIEKPQATETRGNANPLAVDESSPF